MAGIICNRDVTVIHCGLKILVLTKDHEQLHDIPAPVIKLTNNADDIKKKEELRQQKLDAGLSCAAAALSPAGDKIAVCDDRKQVCIFSLPDLSVLNQQTLVRKASCITFNNQGDYVLVADKNGDVYHVPCHGSPDSDPSPKLLLGHLSQLLDMKIDQSGTRVMTADRDEKIRVSHYPNCYNIDSYLLGHTEFVTSLSLSNMSRDMLLSGSGDGTIRVWNYKSGQEVCCHDVTENIADEDKVEPDQSDKDDVMEVDDNLVKRVAAPKQPAVVKLRTINRSGSSENVIVQVESCNYLFLYKHFDNKILFLSHLKLDSCLLDFDTLDQQLIILRKSGKTAIQENYEVVNDELKKNNEILFANHEQFFLPVLNYESEGMKNLHKRWFDNVKEYFDRKEARIEKTKSKINCDSVPVKKPKCES